MLQAFMIVLSIVASDGHHQTEVYNIKLPSCHNSQRQDVLVDAISDHLRMGLTCVQIKGRWTWKVKSKSRSIQLVPKGLKGAG